MAAWDDLKAVALALHRLSESEKKLAELAAENKAAVKELRAIMQELRERQLKIEIAWTPWMRSSRPRRRPPQPSR